ncbi:uncharacterized protein TNCV_3204431 [Trichonephila clavipes]|nr:uncharacterized protein TNCV_3204431 [Trichonephila clavipes]
MTSKGDKAVCVFCSGTVVRGTSSVKRHFETNHKSFYEKTEPEQKELIASAIKDRNKIIQRIKDIPPSRNTIKDTILKLEENVTDQQKKDINSASFISLCIDESIDITKPARLAVFARYWVGNVIKEELIAITSLLTATKCTDICTAVRNSLAEKDIDLKKIVSVTTDGAPNMLKELSETFQFIMYSDVISFDKLNLSQFDWLEIKEFEMQLTDFQSSSIWIQKLIETRKKL